MSFFQVGRSPVMTINSQVLALKYRPQSFKDLIGHEEITDAIYNSIKLNKSPNAFLFTGIRGIGKTTFARIVAKALNCSNGIENLCDTKFCNNCESIINSTNIDVLEVDAASKTGVDDVRELIEFSRYAPSVTKYKIFIIDEVHMLSKQAFNALLKTLEEPPSYLKFIFATTEVKKIPITVLSRCQRYDLSRIESDELFNFIKKIGVEEKKEIEDNAIKLIVKISEGSVRDALSLLDRAFISTNNSLLTFQKVQEIFGFVDKSSYIKLIELIFSGEEVAVINHYRKIYSSGVDPYNFLNDFLEILYFVKNISNIKVDGTSFSLNDKDYRNIELLSKKLNSSQILLFWELTLKTIKEINLVNNQNLSIEMFLIQLMYIDNIYKKKIADSKETLIDKQNNNNILETSNFDTISQIKNVKQEEEKIENKNNEKLISLNKIEDLIQICSHKKEIELKYELENNVNLVSFSKNRIEISFNDKLSKNFVKDLSEKLFNWTNERWIISFSKEKGEVSKKYQKNDIREKKIQKFITSNEYKKISNLVPDIELLDVKEKND